MINKDEQLDKILSEQLKSISPMMAAIPEGEQKEFIKIGISNFQKNKTIDVSEFIEGFSNIKGESIDIEKLRELIKNNTK